jgi:hypothetical protein
MVDNELASSDGFALISPSMPDRHLMIDIETLDTEVTAAVVAIGAVVFDPRAEGGDEAFQISNITKRSNLNCSRTVSQSTLDWWAIQDAEAQMAVFGGKPHTLDIALGEFTRWVNRMTPTCTRVWAKSPDFDCSILRHACVNRGILWPFKFWEARCVRTIMELAYPEGGFPHVEMQGPKHDALADAKKQVIEVQHAYHVLNS